MGAFRVRFVAVLLIAFVAMSAQCIAACAAESVLPVQSPCHKTTDSSCSHDQSGDSIEKLTKVEQLVAVAIIPLAQHSPIAPPSPAVSIEPAPPPPSNDSVSITVLRI
jgi:hypothetical protein